MQYLLYDSRYRNPQRVQTEDCLVVKASGDMDFMVGWRVPEVMAYAEGKKMYVEVSQTRDGPWTRLRDPWGVATPDMIEEDVLLPAAVKAPPPEVNNVC